MWKQFWNWVMRAARKHSKEHARNMNAKGNSGEISGGNKELVTGN